MRKRFMVVLRCRLAATCMVGGDRAGAHCEGTFGPTASVQDLLRTSAAAQRQGLVRMQLVPVVAIGIAVVAVSAEAMQGVLVQSETMRANVADAAAQASDVPAAQASHVFTAKASDVASAAKAAPHVAPPPEPAPVTA